MASYRAVPINAITEVTVGGLLDLPGSRRLLLDLARDASTAGHHLLIDVREAAGSLSFREVYEIVGVLNEHPDAFSGRIAVLDRYDDQFEKTQFFEVSASERGFQVRAFLDREAAVDWLERG